VNRRPITPAEAIHGPRIQERNRDRWAILSALDIGADGDPYLDRLRFLQTPLFGIYLHHIHRPDREPDPHDHPWWMATVIIAGAYTEAVWPDKRDQARYAIRQRRRWSLRHLNRTAAHMITDVRGPLWTLAFVGPKRAGWGFWRGGQFIPWRDYDYPRGPKAAGMTTPQPAGTAKETADAD